LDDQNLELYEAKVFLLQTREIKKKIFQPEFIAGLVEFLKQKFLEDFSSLRSRNETSLILHTINEILSFDRTLRESHFFPPSLWRGSDGSGWTAPLGLNRSLSQGYAGLIYVLLEDEKNLSTWVEIEKEGFFFCLCEVFIFFFLSSGGK
jgi:hypothetical protein